jgi:hypothetical protein
VIGEHFPGIHSFISFKVLPIHSQGLRDDVRQNNNMKPGFVNQNVGIAIENQRKAILQVLNSFYFPDTYAMIQTALVCNAPFNVKTPRKCKYQPIPWVYEDARHQRFVSP